MKGKRQRVKKKKKKKTEHEDTEICDRKEETKRGVTRFSAWDPRHDGDVCST